MLTCCASSPPVIDQIQAPVNLPFEQGYPLWSCAMAVRQAMVQVHVLEDGTVHVYSRNLENTTSKYPDIVARMPQAMAPGVRSVVLDGEVQAWDTEKKVFLPFQVLTTRKRKDVTEDQVKVQVSSAQPCLPLHILQLLNV